MVVPTLGGGGTKVWSQGVFCLVATQDGPLGSEKLAGKRNNTESKQEVNTRAGTAKL